MIRIDRFKKTYWAHSDCSHLSQNTLVDNVAGSFLPPTPLVQSHFSFTMNFCRRAQVFLATMMLFVASRRSGMHIVRALTADDVVTKELEWAASRLRIFRQGFGPHSQANSDANNSEQNLQTFLLAGN
uniref:Uncharacterized protein n=1 Tax=Phaeodactylum tricornutum TaxID=2850 RepID=A0A8J9X3F1_PHATR